MVNYQILKATTDVSIVIRIIDSTDGTPETGVVWNTSGIDMEYRREGAVSVDITEATLAALTTAHADGGFLHIGNGYYRLDLPDAACATGVDGVLVHGTVTGMVVIGCYIQLTDTDIMDGVRGGMTALPNAAADAAGGLTISDTGGLDLDAQDTNINDIETDTGTDIPALIATAQADLDTITDGDGVILGAAGVDAIHNEAIEDHDTQGTMGWAAALAVYAGSDGPGIYIDSGAANTNTVVGTDGTEINPVSTFAAARTLADALGLKIYYLEGNSDATLAATHTDWEFIGLGSVMDNIVNLGSQDVSRSLFRNLTVEGTQGGAGRITARDCALQDPGAGATTLHIFAERCGFVDEIEVDTSNDNVFDQCYSLVAGTAAPIIVATGAAGTISIRHYSGGLEFKTLSASHNVTWEGIGQVIFNADCNVNANVSVRGIGAITDNTAGMASLTETSLVNMTKITTPIATAQADLDTITGADGVTLATAQALYAPSKEGDAMDLVVDAVDASAMTDADVAAAVWVTRTIAELGVAIPSATPNAENAIMMMYMMARNLATATATLEKFYNNAGTAVFEKVISDDATTYTEVKMVAGT